MATLLVATWLWFSAASAPAPQKGDAAALAALLDRAGQYFASFQAEFARVVGFERYRQEVHAPQGGQLVDLESEVFFVGLDDHRTWIAVRNVQSVNGRSVDGESGSVIELLAERGNHARLRELADASARYNIGRLHRNFNDPTLALSFLAPAAQGRFRFEDGPPEVIDGVPAHRIVFEERGRPTIIRDARGLRDIPASGTLAVAEDGRVLQSELRLQVRQESASMIRVTFGYEPRLAMMVPRLMEEEYRTFRPPGSQEVVTGRATYSDYRRFETGARILPPPDPSGPPR